MYSCTSVHLYICASIQKDLLLTGKYSIYHFPKKINYAFCENFSHYMRIMRESHPKKAACSPAEQTADRGQDEATGPALACFHPEFPCKMPTGNVIVGLPNTFVKTFDSTVLDKVQ